MKVYRYAYTCNLQEFKNRQNPNSLPKMSKFPLGGIPPRLETTDLVCTENQRNLFPVVYLVGIRGVQCGFVVYYNMQILHAVIHIIM